MTLLVPLGLLALLSLPLIVILHLMRAQRRRVVVPSLLLWQLLPRQQQAQRHRRLSLTLLLLLHLLVAALLALALAAPQWASALLGGQRRLVLVIDTSASMAAPAGIAQGSRLDAARTRARALTQELRGSATLTLITAGTEAQLLDRASQAGAPRLLAALARVQAGDVGSDLAGALTLAAADLQGQPDGQVLVITDAALPALDSELRRAPQGLAVSWEQVGVAMPNRALITLAASGQTGGGLVPVYARAANYGGAAVASVVRLYGDDQLLDSRAVSFPAQGEVELTWSVPAGIALLRAELDGADQLPADDIALLSLDTTRPLRTLLVSAHPDTLARALRVIPGVQLTVVAPGAYVEQDRLDIDLTVFDGALPTRWPAGAALAINPPSGNALLTISDHSDSTFPGIITSAACELRSASGTTMFDQLSLGGVDFGSIRQITPPEWAQVLLWCEAEPLILRGRLDQSELAVWAFDLSRGNVTGRLAFPLLLTRTLHDLLPTALPAALPVGQPLLLDVDPRVDHVEVRAPDGTTAQVPVAGEGVAPIRMAQAGVYRIRELVGETAIFSGQLAVNAGAARESDLTPRALPATTLAAPQVGEVAHSQQPLWPGCVVLALTVMLGEWIYLHGRRVSA